MLAVMRINRSLLHLSRWSWFALIGATFAAKDVCFGGGRPDPEPPPDAAPSDAAGDGSMAQRARPDAPTLAAIPARARGLRD
jgi:hypothetical protein